MNDLTTLNPDQLPAYLREAYADSTIANLVSAPSIDRISIRGRVWRLIHSGEQVGVNANPSLDVILVAASPSVSRQYFEGEYNDEKREAPTCWSNDGNQPDPTATKRMSAACATCPMNVSGSGKGESKGCRFLRRIAVTLPGQLDHVYAMTIPATSIWGDKVTPGAAAPLSQYANFLNSKKIPIEAVTTRMTFDINESTPTIRFQAVGFLTQNDLLAVKQLAKSDEAREAVQFNAIVREVAALPAAQPMAVAAIQPAALQPVQQPVLAPEPQAAFQFPQQTAAAVQTVQPTAHVQVAHLTQQTAATTGFTTATLPGGGQSLFAPEGQQGQTGTTGFQTTTAAAPAKRGRRAAATATVEAQAVSEPVVITQNASPAQAANQEINEFLKQWSTDD